MKQTCPPNWSPGCTCSCSADEPSEGCYVHGYHDMRQCPSCGLFRGREACKRCGCVYGLRQDAAPRLTGGHRGHGEL